MSCERWDKATGAGKADMGPSADRANEADNADRADAGTTAANVTMGRVEILCSV